MFVVLRTTNKGDRIVKIKNDIEEQELVARFAKAMGHPTRIAILLFLASQESCFFGDIHDDRITTPQGVKRCGAYTRRNRNPESKVLY